MIVNIASDDSTSSVGHFSPEDIQPNAIDLRLDKVFLVDEHASFVLSETVKRKRVTKLINPDESGWYDLRKGTYEITFMSEVEIGPDESGLIVTRSTLNRNGVFISSGLWDSGYRGTLGAALHNPVGRFVVERGTRLAQLVIWKAKALHSYNGQYGRNADGSIKEEEKVYHVAS